MAAGAASASRWSMVVAGMGIGAGSAPRRSSMPGAARVMPKQNAETKVKESFIMILFASASEVIEGEGVIEGCNVVEDGG